MSLPSTSAECPLNARGERLPPRFDYVHERGDITDARLRGSGGAGLRPGAACEGGPVPVWRP
jgi:hypothetical protein